MRSRLGPGGAIRLRLARTVRGSLRLGLRETLRLCHGMRLCAADTLSLGLARGLRSACSQGLRIRWHLAQRLARRTRASARLRPGLRCTRRITLRRRLSRRLGQRRSGSGRRARRCGLRLGTCLCFTRSRHLGTCQRRCNTLRECLRWRGADAKGLGLRGRVCSSLRGSA